MNAHLTPAIVIDSYADHDAICLVRSSVDYQVEGTLTSHARNYIRFLNADYTLGRITSDDLHDEVDWLIANIRHFVRGEMVD